MTEATEPIELDEHGCPPVPPGAASADVCPPSPCEFCLRYRPVSGQPPFEWCQEMKTCAATIDWDKVYGRF